MRFTLLLLLASMPALAGTWSGFLVDSGCYAAEERNRNPADVLHSADSDMEYEIRYCSPTPKTRNFAVVGPEWNSMNLDSPGNTKAIDLIHRIVKRKTHVYVEVTGELKKDTIAVDSISTK
jgi:hypothetical protein